MPKTAKIIEDAIRQQNEQDDDVQVFFIGILCILFVIGFFISIF